MSIIFIQFEYTFDKGHSALKIDSFLHLKRFGILQIKGFENDVMWNEPIPNFILKT
jgi:hypothetical protein